MQHPSAYRSRLAVGLALLFMTAWSLKTAHGFLVHPGHHDRPVCIAEHDTAAQHIHDTRYATDGCTLCAFILSVSILPPVPVWPTERVPVMTNTVADGYQSPPVSHGSGPVPARGPPAV